MKLFISEPVMELLRLEREKFRIIDICLAGTQTINGERFWGIEDVHYYKNIDKNVIEVNSIEFPIWVKVQDALDLDNKIMIRGSKGFIAVPFTEFSLNNST